MSLIAVSPAFARPILQGTQGKYIVTEFVTTTPQKAWMELTNFNSQADWAPDIKRSRVLKRRLNDIELQQTYRAGYTFGLPIKVHLSIQQSPPTGFSYKLIKGDQLKTLQGSWSIKPVNGGVQLTHRIHVDPQLPGALRTFYYEQQEQNLREWMTLLKRRLQNN